MKSSSYIAIGSEVEIFEAAAGAQRPVLLKGPTGTGKTRFVEHMAEKLGRPLISVACHEDLTAADLVGRFLLQGQETVWVDGPLTRAVREGAICYLDEVVEARADTTVVIHPLADHRRELNIERIGVSLKAPPGFMLVLSYNPGYQSVLKDLKPSTRQRMVAIELGFPDPDAEVRIICQETGVEQQVAKRLVDFAQAIRRLSHEGLPEFASTRTLVTAGLLIRQGVDETRACRHTMLLPLSDDAVITARLDELMKAFLA